MKANFFYFFRRFTYTLLSFFFLLIFTTVKADTPLMILHDIQSGETVYSIARKYNVPAQEILSLNEIQNVATDVKIGDLIKVPVEIAKFEDLAKENPLLTDGKRQFRLHKVDVGETFFSLSRKYNSSESLIREKNPILKDKPLQLGQVLVIPLNIPATVSESRPAEPTENFIRHEVSQGEGLFSIARQYGLPSPAPIREWNQLEDDALSVGQILIIYTDVEDIEIVPSREEKIVDDFQREDGWAYHQVKGGETLFSIAREYGFRNPKKIRQWNQLQSDNLQAGQLLKVGMTEGGRTEMPEIEEQTEESLAFTETEDSELDISEPVRPDPRDNPVINEYRNTFQSKISETNRMLEKRGIASWIEDTGREEHFLVLTNEAPIGSIIKVRNLMNNLETYVRVIGRMPATDQNRNLIIKISESAAKVLHVLDERFLVEISIPE
ncbi:MAG: LysM peptidoglycan-binding domain-containing protein [Chitinophagaceae bacterium]|nr:MAG: LysM peptidoglycan-binding domain-containing protein [Chitinophagaceae bacterium]